MYHVQHIEQLCLKLFSPQVLGIIFCMYLTGNKFC